MKREIKFRAKSIDGYWVSGDLHLQCKHPHIHTEERRSIPIDPTTIGQFIGLYDRNGNEIYEGDILKCYDDKTDPLSCDYLCVVRYNTTIESITPGFILCCENIDFPITEFEMVEVIGNEFDNPSLVKIPHQKSTLI
jgi:uncharacterized phage protein (TIGR01671 family)